MAVNPFEREWNELLEYIDFDDPNIASANRSIQATCGAINRIKSEAQNLSRQIDSIIESDVNEALKVCRTIDTVQTGVENICDDIANLEQRVSSVFDALNKDINDLKDAASGILDTVNDITSKNLSMSSIIDSLVDNIDGFLDCMVEGAKKEITGQISRSTRIDPNILVEKLQGVDLTTIKSTISDRMNAGLLKTLVDDGQSAFDTLTSDAIAIGDEAVSNFKTFSVPQFSASALCKSGAGLVPDIESNFSFQMICAIAEAVENIDLIELQQDLLQLLSDCSIGAVVDSVLESDTFKQLNTILSHSFNIFFSKSIIFNRVYFKSTSFVRIRVCY